MQGECDKCEAVPTYDMEIYRRQGEDTYDFQLCHECEDLFWNGGFFKCGATFNWQEPEEEDDE